MYVSLSSGCLLINPSRTTLHWCSNISHGCLQLTMRRFSHCRYYACRLAGLLAKTDRIPPVTFDFWHLNSNHEEIYWYTKQNVIMNERCQPKDNHTHRQLKNNRTGCQLKDNDTRAHDSASNPFSWQTSCLQHKLVARLLNLLWMKTAREIFDDLWFGE